MPLPGLDDKQLDRILKKVMLMSGKSDIDILDPKAKSDLVFEATGKVLGEDSAEIDQYCQEVIRILFKHKEIERSGEGVYRKIKGGAEAAERRFGGAGSSQK